MRSIWTRSPVRCSPLWKRPTRTKRRRGARGARPFFKDAVARLADALPPTVQAQAKLAQAQNRDRKSDLEGKSVSVRVDLGGLRIIKNHNQSTQLYIIQYENNVTFHLYIPSLRLI